MDTVNTDNPSLFKRFTSDLLSVVTSPASWEQKEWGKFLLLSGGTIILINNDLRIKEEFQNNQTDFGTDLSRLGEKFGNALYILPGFGLAYLLGDEQLKNTVILSIESMTINIILCDTIKSLTHRHRPRDGDPDLWDGPSLYPHNRSFPSGHTSTAFTVAAVFAESYKDHPIVPTLAYTLATITAFNRVYGDHHWASDVFAGAVLGTYVGKQVVKLDQDPHRNAKILPLFTDQSYGVIFQIRF